MRLSRSKPASGEERSMSVILTGLLTTSETLGARRTTIGLTERSASEGLPNTSRPKSENGNDIFFTDEITSHLRLFLSSFRINQCA